MFLTTPADIAVFGGASGGGKTWCALVEPLRHVHNARFNATVFRRTTPEVRMSGGLWDASVELYSPLGARPLRHLLQWRFPSGATISFSHLETDEDRLRWQGAEIPLVIFDELTHFSEAQFWYLLSRNRSMSGLRPYVRATTNPDADSWVAKLVQWWIGEDGFPIPDRSGVIRWFCRTGDELAWADSRDELLATFGDDCAPKSFTFVSAKATDNRILLARDPGFVANLKALPSVERQRLLEGNWHVRAAAGTVFRGRWFPIIDRVDPCGNRVRAWDLAATAAAPGTDPDWSVGVLISRPWGGAFTVEDVVRFRGSPLEVERRVLETARRDGNTLIAIEVEPGSAGKMVQSHMGRVLAGQRITWPRPTEAKLERAGAAAAQAEAGNVQLLKAPWNDAFLRELDGFPTAPHDDQVDAFTSGFNVLANSRRIMLA